MCLLGIASSSVFMLSWRQQWKGVEGEKRDTAYQSILNCSIYFSGLFKCNIALL